ncbi:MAG: 2-C-methyl-D-erythritol 4-phosphate cytidylyltransferase [Burkholderiaceae bacterium]
MTSTRCAALVPAAGIGARFGADGPKQYLEILGRPVIVHTIDALLRADWLDAVHVVIAADDGHWRFVHDRFGGGWSARVVVHRCGGANRRDSVLAGLSSMRDLGAIAGDDWVFVHDAARPGLPRSCLRALRAALEHEPVGALLAVPVADTLKRALQDGADARVRNTESRENLWLAQTPQVFRHAALLQALLANEHVTDEASAIEATGGRPLLVTGSWRNTKLTLASDLSLVSQALAHPEDIHER